MYEGKTIGVVIPAYNEEGFVGDVIDTVPEFVDRVYVVDDCSTDGTWAEVRGHATRMNRSMKATPDEASDRTAGRRVRSDGSGVFDRRAVPIRHETNRGVGAAITTGYRRALEDGLDVTAVMNGDGQMDPDILDRIIGPVVDGEADYAKGNRFRDYGEMPRLRLVGNVLLTLLTKFASGYWGLLDPQNGYTAISRRALEQLDLDALYESYGFVNDVLVRLNAHGMRVADVPMRAVYGEETSGIRYSSFIPSVSLLLLSLFLWRLTERHLVTEFPAALYPLGVLGATTGTGGFVVTLWSGLGAGVVPAAAPWLALFVCGCALVLLALAVELRLVRDGARQAYDAESGVVE